MIPKDWTPIKIPGKNKRPTTKSEVAARKALNRPRGRPYKAVVSSQPSQDKQGPAQALKKQKKRSLKDLKSRYKLSYLEKLPVELLEQIFFHCKNCNLPRASPIFAGKLSSEKIYIELLTEAFRDSWEICLVYQHRNRENEEREERDLIYEGLFGKKFQEQPSTGDSKFQSDLLGCRWAILPLILRAQELWYERLSSSSWKDMPHIIEKGGVRATQLFEERFRSFMELGPERLLTQSSLLDPDFYYHTRLDDGVEIPQSLLLGPWSEEMVRYLYWIMESNGQVDDVDSIHGEIALLGLKNAISIGNIHVIALLAQMGLSHQISTDFLVEALQYAGGDITTIFHLLLRVAVPNLRGPAAAAISKALWSYRDDLLAEGDQERLTHIVAIIHLDLLPQS